MRRWFLLAATCLAWAMPVQADLRAETKVCRTQRAACERDCRPLAGTERQECKYNCAMAATDCVEALRSDRPQPASAAAGAPRYGADPWPYLISANETQAWRYVMSNEDEPRAAPLVQSRVERKTVYPAELRQRKVLTCHYGAGDNQRHLAFWHPERPALPDRNKLGEVRARAVDQELGIKKIADVAVDACPATWGAALEAGFGPQVWQKIAEGRARARRELGSN